jgi:hypothetical protein
VEEAFGRCFGPVVRQNTEWMNINSVKINVLLRILGKKEVRLPFGIRDTNTLTKG